MALAGGVVLKALHQRPNFYSAAVYLAQSSANLMVRLGRLTPVHVPLTDSQGLDPDQPHLPDRMYIPPGPPETPVRPPTAD